MRIRSDGIWAQPVVSIVGVFVGVALVHATLYLYSAHPAWAWLYLLDPARTTGLAAVSVLAACLGAVGAGFYGAGKLVRREKDRVVLAVLAGIVAVLLLLAFLLRERLFSYGSYADFHRGRALPLGAVKLGYVLIALFIGLFAAASFVVWEIFRDSRRVGMGYVQPNKCLGALGSRVSVCRNFTWRRQCLGVLAPD